MRPPKLVRVRFRILAGELTRPVQSPNPVVRGCSTITALLLLQRWKVIDSQQLTLSGDHVWPVPTTAGDCCELITCSIFFQCAAGVTDFMDEL